MATKLTLRLQQLMVNTEKQFFNKAISSRFRRCSSHIHVKHYKDRDPAPFFFNENVQNILKRLTGSNVEKIFRSRLLEQSHDIPKYEFMTDEELQKHLNEADTKAKKLLQMPPVLKLREPIDEIVSRDPALKGYETSKIIFTDITYGISDRKRIILVRDVDGTLRHGSWEERARMNEIYNPRPGRKLKMPKMFEEENLKDVIAREKYEFVLDQACAQFEPDDPEYQRISSLTYEAVDNKEDYEKLHSTRHYGPLCFYLTWNKQIDKLLIYLIGKEKLSDCTDLVQLYYLLHKPELASLEGKDALQYIKFYIEEESLRRPQLQLVLQNYQDILNDRKQYQESVKASHGL